MRRRQFHSNASNPSAANSSTPEYIVLIQEVVDNKNLFIIHFLLLVEGGHKLLHKFFSQP